MINFIVIEDDIASQEVVRKVLRKFSMTKENQIDIKYFTKYDKELQEIVNDTSRRKIYILDIELETQVSGIEIAKKIRKKDWESELIFLTCHDKMFETVYRSVYEVFDFIEKFYNMEKRLEHDLKMIFQKNFDNKMFIFTSRNADLQIYYRAITHITRDKEERKIVLHTDINKFKINMKLVDALKLLDGRFMQTHRGCIANSQRVQQWNWAKGYFVLDTGEKVECLSKSYKMESEVKC